MAEVFAARATDAAGAPSVVAIKRPRRDIIDEKYLIAMFLDEARLASHVRSPHVVETLELGTDDGQPYLVMPMVVGVSLHRLIARGPMPPNVAAEIGAQAALGLDAAHRATDAQGTPLGIVHRDVSPQNVMVDVDGLARMADFGVATAYSRITRTRTGQIKGKLGYLSPEQIHGEKVDPRSDVFALGIVVWEMLAGRRLVRAKPYLDAHPALDVYWRVDRYGTRKRRRTAPSEALAVLWETTSLTEVDRLTRWEAQRLRPLVRETLPELSGEHPHLERYEAGFRELLDRGLQILWEQAVGVAGRRPRLNP